MSIYVYILELTNQKYYVGKTKNPDFRIQSHFDNNGSEWTKKYKVINLLELISNCDDYDEDKYTIKYMSKFGINNVRGGSFCKIKLTDENITTLNQIINGINDKCFICGKNNHFAVDCKKFNKEVDNIPTINLDEKCDCITSFIKTHRRGKCLINKIINYFDSENDNVDKLLQQTNNTIDKKENDDIIDKKENNDIIDKKENDIIIDNKKEENETILNKKNEDINVMIKCSYCEKEFTTKKGATYHEIKYCKKNVTRLKYNCRYCDKKFDSQNGAKYHEDKYCKNKTFSCSYCNREFETENGAKYHENKYCKSKIFYKK